MAIQRHSKVLALVDGAWRKVRVVTRVRREPAKWLVEGHALPESCRRHCAGYGLKRTTVLEADMRDVPS